MDPESTPEMRLTQSQESAPEQESIYTPEQESIYTAWADIRTHAELLLWITGLTPKIAHSQMGRQHLYY